LRNLLESQAGQQASHQRQKRFVQVFKFFFPIIAKDNSGKHPGWSKHFLDQVFTQRIQFINRAAGAPTHVDEQGAFELSRWSFGFPRLFGCSRHHCLLSRIVPASNRFQATAKTGKAKGKKFPVRFRRQRRITGEKIWKTDRARKSITATQASLNTEYRLLSPARCHLLQAWALALIVGLNAPNTSTENFLD
jgi:hypothetical protein